MFSSGQEIGPYTLVRQIGRGGFGEVWLAEKRSKFVTTKVAIKLPLAVDIDPEAIRNEAVLWEKVSGHPNVVPIIDAHEYDGQIVIASEFAPDGSLADRLGKIGVLPVETAINLTIQILDGLEYLHKLGIIHRDLKPANVLLQGDVPKLADFGISRALRSTMTSQSQNISGTFAYMSPEALDGKRSIKTDIWSVGVNLFFFLSGGLPFPKKELSSLVSSILMNEPEPLPDSVPSGLQTIVAKALEKDSASRYSSAAEMREELQRVLRALGSDDQFVTELPKTTLSPPVVKFSESDELIPETVEEETASRDPIGKTQGSFTNDETLVLEGQDETAGRGSAVVSPTHLVGDETSESDFPVFSQYTESRFSRALFYSAGGLLLLGVIGFGSYLVSGYLSRDESGKEQNLGKESAEAELTSDGNTNSDMNKLDDAAPLPQIDLNEANAANSSRSTNAAKPANATPTQKPVRTPDRKKTPETKVASKDTDLKTGSDAPPPAPNVAKRISKGVVNGSAISLPKPAYPAEARAVNAKGSVSVAVVISKSGNVISATAVSGNPLLRSAAASAARRARFRPTLLRGRAVEVSGVIVYNFN